MVNMEWLRYFVVLAEVRNVSVAAERLSVTPQALSKALAGMEAHYGAVLIERDHRIRRLSPAGEIFAARARGLLQEMENLDRELADVLAGEPSGPITIASVGLWVHGVLPDVLQALLGEHPRVVPRLHRLPPADVQAWLLAGEADVGLLLHPPDEPELACTAGFGTPYVIAGVPRPPCAWHECGFIVPRRHRGVQPRDGWPASGYERRVVMEADMLETSISLAEAGVGVVFVPALAIRRQLTEGRLAVVAATPVSHEDRLHIVWRRGRHLTHAARKLINALTRVEPVTPTG